MSLPPIIKSPLFNSSYFSATNGYLTITTGDQRYLKYGGVGALSALSFAGNLDCGSLTIGGSALDLSGLSYVSGITAGFGAANKALVLDSNRNITNLDGIRMGSSNDTARFLSILNNTLATNSSMYGLTYGYDNTNQAEFAFNYIGSGSTSDSFSIGFYGNTNIFKVAADQSVDIPFHNGTTGLKLGGTLITATAAQINYVNISTAGTAQARLWYQILARLLLVSPLFHLQIFVEHSLLEANRALHLLEL